MAALPEGFQLEQPAGQQASVALPPGFEIEQAPKMQDAAILEPVAAIGAGVATTIGGGLAGLASAPFVGAEGAAEIVKDIQSTAFQPKTEGGKLAMQKIGEAAQAGVDVANASIGQLASLGAWLTGKSDEEQFQAFEEVKDKGIGKFLGEATFQATGSPLAATVAEVLPTAVTEIAGAKGSLTAAKAAPKIAEGVSGVAEKTLDVTGTALAPVAETGKELAKAVFDFQTPAKRKIAELLEAGSDDVETAGFRLAKDVTPKPDQPTKLQQFLDVGGPKVEKVPAASESIKQGFDKGVIAAVQGASKADQAAMARMVNIAERVKSNARFGVLNRPSDVAGDILMGRLNTIRKSNRVAGKEIDKVARSLKDKPVDVSDLGQQFTNSLDDMGIGITDDLKLDFKGSVIEGLPGPERVITSVFNRMKSKRVPDANDVHNLKRFIDEQITFGKNAEGLAGDAEKALKNIRFGIKEKLNSQFPKYGEANTVYSETIQALDAFQDVAGRKMNLTGPDADKETGTLMRRLMGNAQSRINLLNSIEDIERIARKHGGFGGPLKIEGKVDKAFDNDLLTQVLFADELDAVFGPAARTSLQGQFDQSLKQAARAATSRGGAADVGIGLVGEAVEKARNINEGAAFKAIKELLKGE